MRASRRSTRRTAAWWLVALPMVGVDFIVRDEDAVLLEINAYPGLDDAPGAVDAFADAVAAWAVNLETFGHAARARWLA